MGWVPMHIDIEDTVSDWGSFEKLIFALCETGGVSVKRNLVLIGKSGSPRQMDVAIRSRQGLVETLVLVECKFWKRSVTRQHVENLASSVSDLNASRGIIFTTRGFQKGAVTFAKHSGIDLFRVRYPQASEILTPTTPLDQYLHYAWRSLRNLQFPGIYSWDRDLSASNIDIVLGGANQTKTPVNNAEHYRSRFLENIIDYWTGLATTNLALEAKSILFDGAGGVRRFWRTVRQTADPPIEVPIDGAIALIPEMRYDLGITLWQEYRNLTDFQFVLAIEDSIRGAVFKASRRVGDESTIIGPTPDHGPFPDRDPLSYPQRVGLMQEWVPFDFERMERGRLYDSPGAPEFFPPDAIEGWTFRMMRRRPAG